MATSRELTYGKKKVRPATQYSHRRITRSLPTASVRRSPRSLSRCPEPVCTLRYNPPQCSGFRLLHFPQVRPFDFSFYLGDCLDLLDRLPRGSIDAIVTSPPYNLGLEYRTYDDTMPRDRYLAWTANG